MPFAKGFGKVLEATGFRRDRGSTWTRDNGEVYSVVDLQKSQYGESCYVNLGVILKEIWPAGAKVATRQSHLVERLNLVGLVTSAELLEHPRDLEDCDIEVLRRELTPAVEAYFARFDSSVKMRRYALIVENVVPIPRRELREWAGFDFSLWKKPADDLG